MAARDDNGGYCGRYTDADADEEGYFPYDSDDDDAIYDDADGTKGASSSAIDKAANEEEEAYAVLTESEVRARQAADTAKVAEVLSIPAGFAAALLRRFRWAPDRVQEEWFSDERRARHAAGLPPPGAPLAPVAVAAGGRVDCGICFAGGHEDVVAAGCRAHFYCRECWQGYVHAAVDDGARCLSLRCPDPSCSAAVARELVDEVAAEEDRIRYASFAFRSYVEDSGERMKWCPGRGCGLAVAASSSGEASVSCACGHVFCYGCGEEAHRPVTCETVRAWAAKNASDSENANWVLVHAKPCPRCRRPIEKNQGCMHMTCTAPCHHEFCWVCLDPWRHHQGCAAFKHQQNHDAHNADDGNDTDFDYDDGDGDAAMAMKMRMEARQRHQHAKASLDRYLYHYERWAANQQSLNMAVTDMEQLRRYGLQAMAAAAGASDTSKLEFMAEAYGQIVDGRRVLRWTYAYAISSTRSATLRRGSCSTTCRTRPTSGSIACTRPSSSTGGRSSAPPAVTPTSSPSCWATTRRRSSASPRRPKRSWATLSRRLSLTCRS